MAGSIPRLSPRYKPRPRAGLDVYERAFVSAYVGRAGYNVARAAAIVGLSEERGFQLFGQPRILAAIRYKIKGKAMPNLAIEAELSEVGGASFRPTKLPDGTVLPPDVGAREKVKALEVLATLRNLNRDPVSLLLERVLIQDLAASRLKGQTSAPRLLTGDIEALRDDPNVSDAELVAVDRALDEGAELGNAAREKERAEKEEKAQAQASTPQEVEQGASPTLTDRKL